MRTLVGETQRGFIPNALMQLADCYIEAGDYDRAIELARECLRKSPNFANAHFGLGRALAKQGRYAQAREAFLAAIADAAHSARQFVVDEEVSAWKAHSEIGSSFGYEGNDEAALEWFDRALVNRPNVVPLRMNRAKALERLGRYAEAQAAFRALADDEPGDAHTSDYINYLLRRESFVLAVSEIERVLDVVTPRTAASMLTTAARLVVHTGLGDAQTYLRRALAAFPGAGDALDALEAVYRSRGDLAALERLHADELDAPLEIATDFARRGSRLLAAGRLADAEAVSRRGLEVAAADPSLNYNLAAVLVQTNRRDEALQALAQCGTAGDVGLRATFLRAIVLGDVGRYHDAIREIDVVIARAPAEVDAHLRRFKFAEALGWEAEAERTLRAALELGDARVATELAAWYLSKGRFTDARIIAESALAST
jgi:tetratricopeptide (TPR) repeat protein